VLKAIGWSFYQDVVIFTTLCYASTHTYKEILMAQELGFTRDMFIMPFDHRGSFQEKLFGIKGHPTPEQTAEIASYKKIIYDGFKMAVAAGVPKDKAGILVDEQFGTEILKDAKSHGYMTACPAEKSGQNEFDFEYGSEFGAHINKFQPTFVKVLVRYNPEDDAALNKRQNERLKKLADYCHAHNEKFMFELLVPATKDQLAKLGGDTGRYDRELRPSLMVRAMIEIQNAGVEADIWKLEGIETPADSVKVAQTARNTPARKNVGVIVLGRGENAEKVKLWLTTAAKVPGLIGFAVGRTIFWEPLVGVKNGKWDKAQASKMVCDNYKGFCDLWQKARA
jgi:myo-inositol catabolism protein IolC